LGRVSAMGCAVAVAGTAFFGLTTGVAHADPSCPDVHWMGAAGSGERDFDPVDDPGYDPTAHNGMGPVVYQSYRALERQLQQDGRTITAEAVEYPAKKVPDDPGVLDWADFIGSVDVGKAALEGQYAAFTQRCPNTKVVLAGYSQGAMVVHRNLHALAGTPNLAAALLIADGDRIPDDNTVKIGSATSDPEAVGGAAQDWPILAHAPTEKLPANLGTRTISVCDAGDVVCDYDPDAEEETTATAVAIHTGYDVDTTDGQMWTWMLHQFVGASSTVTPGGPSPSAPVEVMASE
jgi:Cutinase